jgi:hypothetical protein
VVAPAAVVGMGETESAEDDRGLGVAVGAGVVTAAELVLATGAGVEGATAAEAAGEVTLGGVAGMFAAAVCVFAAALSLVC